MINRESTRDQAGFSPTVVVLSVVIVIAIGFAAYHGLKDHDGASKTSVSVGSPTPSSTASPDASLLTISRLGISIMLPSEIKDAVYVLDSTGYANFSTKSLIAAGGSSCAAGASGVPDPIGQVIVSATAPNQQSGEGSGGLGQYVKPLGAKYLYFNGPQAVCGDSQAANNLETKQLQALKDALSSARAAN